jgi:hypothetical protein
LGSLKIVDLNLPSPKITPRRVTTATKDAQKGRTMHTPLIIAVVI